MLSVNSGRDFRRLYELYVFLLVEIKKAFDGTNTNVCVIRVFVLSVFVLTVLDCSGKRAAQHL